MYRLISFFVCLFILLFKFFLRIVVTKDDY